MAISAQPKPRCSNFAFLKISALIEMTSAKQEYVGCKKCMARNGFEGRRYGFNVANRRLAEVATGRTGVRGIAAIP
jgi:hypothetical protein